MAAIDFQAEEITIKLVYWGPALSGKTTNVRSLHGFIPSRLTGELASLDTEDERTIFFDYMPVKAGPIGPYHLNVKIFSVPGQAHYRRTRQIVLHNADGVIFVADSSPQELDANVTALRDLEDSLRSYGIDPDDLPVVFLYNKRDLPGALPITTLERALNPREMPSVAGVAIQGQGVLEAFNALMDGVREQVTSQLTRADTARSIERGPSYALGSQGAFSPASMLSRIASVGEHGEGELARAHGSVKGRATSAGPAEPLQAHLEVDSVEYVGDGRLLKLRGEVGGAPVKADLHLDASTLRALMPSQKPVANEEAPSPLSESLSIVHVGLAIGFIWLGLLTITWVMS